MKYFLLTFIILCSSLQAQDQQQKNYFLSREGKYVIVEYFATTYFVEMQGFLIYDRDSLKYNLYVCDYFQLCPPFTPEKIMQNINPQPIKNAIICYPYYNFTEDNYGF